MLAVASMAIGPSRLNAAPFVAQTMLTAAPNNNIENNEPCRSNGCSGGFFFTMANPVLVTHFGFFDDGLDGFGYSAGPHSGTSTVGIFNTAGTLLVSGAVSSSDPAENITNYISAWDPVLGIHPATGGFRFAALSTPFLLNPGNYYIVGTTQREAYKLDQSTVFGPGISYRGVVFGFGGSTLTSPTLGTPPGSPILRPGGALGPNFKYDTDLSLGSGVPEPGTWMLMGAGLLGLISLRKRRR